MKALLSSAGQEAGDLDPDVEYYRILFRPTVRGPGHLEKVVRSLRSDFTPEGIRKARAIEMRLYDETWISSQNDLLPKLKRLGIPTLVIHEDYDFVPVVCAEHIAQAMPGAQPVVLKECGHFSYLECPQEVHKVIADFFDNPK